LGHSWSLGAIYFILGEYVRAEAHLNYGLENEDSGPLLIYEMRVRPLMALTYVAMNRLDDAAEQVARCRQIMAGGEDWRGRAGDVARAEAVIAAARSDYDLANRQFETALAIHRKYHLAFEEADTLQFWGRALAAAGDRTGAIEKFDAAVEASRARGVGPRFIEYVQADKARALRATPTEINLHANGIASSANSKTLATFRREGEFWTIAYAGATLRLKDAKGLHYIAYLLERPGQRIHVHDLIAAVEGSASNGRTAIHADSEDLEIVRDIGGAGATIDARARAEYRARLRDLNADLGEAERMNDLGRAERIRNEIEMVADELTASSGLGGRARAASGGAERARGVVGKNVRSVLAKIRRENPALGRYFASAISTGNFCSYQPEPDHPISWQF
jgi:tetratricopeptide (TPR) repeat protein